MSKVQQQLQNSVMNGNVNQTSSVNSELTDILNKPLDDDHYSPSVRVLQILKTANGSCGFHLSRSKWDPYPWVSAVDENTPAEMSGLKAGDCVLEVNGEDIIGLRISKIAELVKLQQDCVTLLLWSTSLEPFCDPESLCCGPMPQNLERLSAAMQTILGIIECPVCLDTIPPPAMQCQNGHLLCVQCKVRSEKCPVCRQRYMAGRCLIAEQIYNSVTDAFNLRIDMSEGKLREKLFGAKFKKKQHSLFEVNNKFDITNTNTNTNSNTNSNSNNRCSSPSSTGMAKNKFLAKLLGKSTSLDNLSSSNVNPKNDTNLQLTPVVNNNNGHSNCTSIATLKHFSLSANDLSKKDKENLIAIPRCPSISGIYPNGNLLGNVLTMNRRPCISLSASTEFNQGIDRSHCDSEVSLTIAVPVLQQRTMPDVNLYQCPCNCGKKFNGTTTLQQHVKVDHNTPIMSFGMSSTEISLPAKSPIKDAALILLLDGKQFWIKFTVDENNDSIFISGLLEGSEDESFDYMIETRLRNRVNDRILEKELITRSIVHSLMKTSWNKIFDRQLGIFYNQESIRTTFLPNNHNNNNDNNGHNNNGDGRSDGNGNGDSDGDNRTCLELLLTIVIKHRN